MHTHVFSHTWKDTFRGILRPDAVRSTRPAELSLSAFDTTLLFLSAERGRGLPFHAWN